MRRFWKRLSMVPGGLRHKLIIAFALMSIIPLLVTFYLINNFLFEELKTVGQISLSMLISILLAFLGFLLARRIVDPIIDMALQVKIIAEGNYNHKLNTDREDEIGDLGRSINVMTDKIRFHMLELEGYSAKTQKVNLDIQRKVLALSSLLHIGDMIAGSEKLESIFSAAVEKVGEIDDDNFTAFFLAEDGAPRMVSMAAYNMKSVSVKKVPAVIDDGPLSVVVSGKTTISSDSSLIEPDLVNGICDVFGARNFIISPVVSRGKGVGFMIAGNNKKDYIFQEDYKNLLSVLTKQLGIAIEKDILQKKTQELSIKDELTGLYNTKFIRERLDEEIKRAILYQRPCSLLLFNLDDFKPFRDRYGEILTEDALKAVACVLKKISGGVSKVARIGGDGFAVILPEKNKKEATQMAESVRKEVEGLEFGIKKKKSPILTISGGVSENPIDGASAGDLFTKAGTALKRAKHEGKNRIST